MSTLISISSVFSDAWRRRRAGMKIDRNRPIAQESDQRVGTEVERKRGKKPENNMNTDLGTELQDQENEYFYHDE